MIQSRYFSHYICRNLLNSIALISLLVTGIVILFEIFDLAQRGVLLTRQPFTILIDITSHTIPFFQDILPLIILFAGLRVFIKLHSTSQIIAMKAAGGSIWTIIKGPVALVFIIGALVPLTIDPLNRLVLNIKENRLSIENRSRIISGQSQWFTQSVPQIESNAGHTIIYAGSTSADGTVLGDVKIFDFDADGRLYQQRLAQSAQLTAITPQQNSWVLSDVVVYTASKTAKYIETDSVNTSMSAHTVRTQFGDALTLPIWSLFAAIVDNDAGVILRPDVRMRFYSLVALPIFLVSSLMVAVVFTVSYRRQGVSHVNVLLSILVGFAIYVFIRMVQTSGNSGIVAAPIAAFGPALLILVTCTTILLFLEDG